MKLAVLTTKTTHHTWFIQKLNESYKDIFCILETESLKAKFQTEHPFERERDLYEQSHILNNKDHQIKDLVYTKEFRKINDAGVLQALNNFSPDLIIVFGTGKIKENLIETFKGRILNLHGGDPELYRGLDTHLWAIYHNDFSNITTTIHHLDVELDRGNIIKKQKLNLKSVSHLYQLRAINTETCLDLTISAINMLKDSNTIASSPQESIGRYYSFMPSDLKEVCNNKFTKFKSQL